MKAVDLLGIYRKRINPPYSRKDLTVIAATVLILIILPLTVFAGIKARSLLPKAETTKDVPVATTDEPTFLSNELLIKVAKEARGKVKEGNPADTGIASLNNINQQHQVKKFEKVAKVGKNSKSDAEIFAWYKITLPGKSEKITGKLEQVSKERNHINPAAETLRELAATLHADPNIQTVEPNYIVSILPEAIASSTPSSAPSQTTTNPPTTTATTPNDPYYASSGSWGQSYQDLWGMHKINAAGAWDQTTGSNQIIVAGIDTGVDRNHEDLQGQMWVNAAETPGNGIDDDGNGYKDDYYGWDWVAGDPDPMDDHGHGTHTVGTIAAVGNNAKGVVGVNWVSKIMALKFLSSGGSGSLDNGIKALQYAADMGAKVSSNSWGCACQSTMTEDAVKYEHDKGMIVVAAAGNSNGDALDFSPASADHALTIAASDYNDAKASFSNWGEKIDVAAPGVDTLSLKASVSPMCTAERTVGTNYCRVSGTSMATPHVAGLAALLLAKNPTLTNEEIRQIIRNGADDLGATGKDRDFGYGRINAAGSMSLATAHPLTPYITSPRSRTAIFGATPVVQITGSIGGPNFASYKVEVGTGRTPSSWTLVTTSSVQPITNTTLANLDTSKFAEGKYMIRLTATDTAGKIYQFQVNDITIDNFDAVIDFPRSLFSFGSTDIVGTAITKNGMPFANYTIEWGVGYSPTTWSTAGITLTNGGLQPVSGGKLGTWNTSSLTDGQTYTLRLTVNSSLSSNQQTTANPKGDKDLVPGWPKYLPTAYLTELIPTLADLNGDGGKELIYALPDGKIYAYKKDGNSMPGFPVTLVVGDYSNLGMLNVDDLDGDGKKEIVVTSILVQPDYRAFPNINIIRSDGTFYPGWPRVIASQGGLMSPAITDLDGDGTKDIIFMQVATWVVKTDLTLHAYHLNGTELAGFPTLLKLPPVGFDPGQLYPTSFTPSLSIADLDGDGKPEIAFNYSTLMILFDNIGKVLSGWPFFNPTYNGKQMLYYSAPASGDVYGDGNREVFSAAVADGCLECQTQLYGWKKDGTVLSGWPKTTASDGIMVPWFYYSTPSFADVDNDGKDEIVTGLNSLAIFDVEGKKQLSNSPSMQVQPALSDVDGDGQLELAGGWYNTLSIVKQNATNYSVYWQRINNGGNYFVTPPAIADMDNNGQMEMAAIDRPAGYSGGILSGGINSIYLWNIPKTASNPAKYEWPMFGHDPARTGRLVVDEQPPQPKPGDINSDGVVNIFDLSILLSNWGATGGVADINKDGRVDIFDLSILLSNWTG